MLDLLETVINRGQDMGGTDASWYAKHGTATPRSSRWKNRAGNQTRRIKDEDVVLAAKMRERGQTWTEIGRKLGRDPTTVRRRVTGEREDLKRPGGREFGEVTDEKIVAARGLRALGHTWVWIARELGCHESTLRRRVGK